MDHALLVTQRQSRFESGFEVTELSEEAGGFPSNRARVRIPSPAPNGSRPGLEPYSLIHAGADSADLRLQRCRLERSPFTLPQASQSGDKCASSFSEMTQSAMKTEQQHARKYLKATVMGARHQPEKGLYRTRILLKSWELDRHAAADIRGHCTLAALHDDFNHEH